MVTRVTFDAEFAHAIRVRGLTLADVARQAQVTVATVSAAVNGRSVNMRSAVLLSRAVASCPVIGELEAWLAAPGAAQGAISRGDASRPR